MLARDVMSKDVVTASPDESPVDVGNRLLENRISCAVVVDGERILGIVSKESFVMGMNYLGQRPLEDFAIQDFMVKKFDVINADDSIETVVDKLLEVPYRIDRLPVVENGRLAGILSKGDVTRIFSEEAGGRFCVRDLMQYEPQIVHDYTPLPEILKKVLLSNERKVLVCAGNNVVGIITILDLAVTIFEKKRVGENYTGLAAGDVMTKNPVIAKPGDDAAGAAGLMTERGIGGLPVIGKKLDGIFTKADVVKGYKLLLTK